MSADDAAQHHHPAAPLVVVPIGQAQVHNGPAGRQSPRSGRPTAPEAASPARTPLRARTRRRSGRGSPSRGGLGSRAQREPRSGSGGPTLQIDSDGLAPSPCVTRTRAFRNRTEPPGRRSETIPVSTATRAVLTRTGWHSDCVDPGVMRSFDELGISSYPSVGAILNPRRVGASTMQRPRYCTCRRTGPARTRSRTYRLPIATRPRGPAEALSAADAAQDAAHRPAAPPPSWGSLDSPSIARGR